MPPPDLKSVPRSLPFLSRVRKPRFQLGEDSKETLRLFLLTAGGISGLALLMGTAVCLLLRP